MIIGTFVIFIQLLQIFRCVPITETGDPLQEQYGLLKHASVLHRHGDRGPLSTFPLDPYKNYPWPDGFGQLINKGKRRLVEVGKWFRARYQNFISDTYTRRHVYVQSSSIDRCIMSTQCLLYGFYPAVGEQIWLPNEKWQPIPVYAIPTQDDNKLQQSKNCTLKDVLWEEETNDPEYVLTYDEYEQTIDTIVNETGIDVTNKTKAQILERLDYISSTFLIYVQNNLTLPEWTKQVYPEPLQTILSKTVWKTSFNLQKSRIDAGPFLESVIEDMNRKILDKEYEQKLHIYSAHDITIKNIMIGLQVYDDVSPAYGSTLIFELREKNSTDYVTVSYRNDTSASHARLLDVPGCGLVCTFEQFYEVTKPLIPQNWDEECESVSTFRENLLV